MANTIRLTSHLPFITDGELWYFVRWVIEVTEYDEEISSTHVIFRSTEDSNWSGYARYDIGGERVITISIPAVCRLRFQWKHYRLYTLRNLNEYIIASLAHELTHVAKGTIVSEHDSSRTEVATLRKYRRTFQ